MTIEAKLTSTGMTRGKRYDVICESDHFYKIVLDSGKVGVRHKHAFDIVNPDKEDIGCLL